MNSARLTASRLYAMVDNFCRVNPSRRIYRQTVDTEITGLPFSRQYETP